MANHGSIRPLVWDQHTFVTANSEDISEVATANDFVLAGPASLASFTVLLSDDNVNNNGVLDSFGNTLGWAIYSNNGGEPGTLLYSGQGVPVLTDTLAQDDFGSDIVSATLSFGQSIRLDAGTYWLALHEGYWGSVFDGTNVWWQLTPRVGAGPMAGEPETGPGDWHPAANTFDGALSIAASSVWDRGDFVTNHSEDASTEAVANDFFLDGPRTIDSITVTLSDEFVNNNGIINSFSGTLGWAIYANAGGQPGTLLFSGQGTPVMTDTGLQDSGNTDIVNATISLPNGVTLAGGSYWLAIHEGAWGSAFDGSRIWWQSTAAVGGNQWSGEPETGPTAWTVLSTAFDGAFTFGGRSVWDHSPFTTQNSEDISSESRANDFTLSSTTSLSGATVWLADDVVNDNGVLDSFSGTLGWAIYADNGGLPGTLLLSGQDAAPTITDTGIQDDFGSDIARFDFSFSSSLVLAPGTYWLAVHEGAWGAAYDGSQVWWQWGTFQNGQATIGLGSNTHWVSDPDVDAAFVVWADPVVARDDSGTTTNEDAPAAIHVQANDVFDGSTYSIAAGTASHGTVAVNINGTAGDVTDDFLVYTPAADFNGTDTFTYTLTAGNVTDTATVTVTVNAVADIVNDTATTSEQTSVSIHVLANDGFEGTPQISGNSNGTFGTVTLQDGGTPGITTDDFLLYLPRADFNGADTFTYTVTSSGTVETATVTVTVNPVADIVNDTATTNEDTAVNILVLGNDTFEATPQITGTTNGAHGSVTVNNNGTPGNTADDFVVYTPAADFNGTDTFTYTVTSNGTNGTKETATVTVTVNAVADIVADPVTVAQDSLNTLDLLANDTFENGGRSITTVGAAAHGTVFIDTGGTPGDTTDDAVVYAPAAGYSGLDAFTYTVTTNGTTETATVSVTVTPTFSGTVTPGNDSLVGTEGPDTIAGLAGDDIIDGLGSGDFLFGNQDNDTVLGRAGNDTIWGGLGNDSLDGSTDSDFLWGNEGADTLTGGDGDNTIVGGQDSSDAADSITAGAGADIIWGNGGADTITADGGNNTLIGGFGKDTIVSGAGADIIFGNEDADTIAAGDGANTIFGGLGDDSILAGSGNDSIFGNEGNDTIAGGAGADRLVFAAGSGADQINGFVFGEGDRLDLQGQTFTQGTSADGDVLLTLSGGGTIELNGVAPAAFSPGFVV